jgi:hypothetical protein
MRCGAFNDAVRHLIEQPIDGDCESGTRPPRATADIASNSSRAAVGSLLRPDASSRP